MNENDESLRWQLRALRQDQPPANDLWAGIAARIADLPQAAVEDVRPAPARVRRFAPWAMAASVVLSVGLIWQMVRPADVQEPVIQQEAASLTRDYQGALAQLQGGDPHPELSGAIEELDRSAVQIRAALQRDPNARFLLNQLRRTYAKRLALTQRAMMS